MGTITLFTNFIRSIQALLGYFLCFSLRSKKAQASRDIEAGIPVSFCPSFDDTDDIFSGAPEAGILDGMSSPDNTSDRSQPLTLEISESPILSRVSTVYPVKNRIVDAIMKNVQDKHTGLVKFVVITSPSAMRRSCRVRIEHVDPSAIGTITSSIRAINVSRRVARLAILPTFLHTTEITPSIHGLSESSHSIYDLFDLFPPPPTPTSPQIPATHQHDVEEASSPQLDTTGLLSPSTEQLLPLRRMSSLSMTSPSEHDTPSETFTSLHTAAISPPATPDLIKATSSSCRNSTDSAISLTSRPSKRFKPVIVNGSVYECIRRNCSQSSTIADSLPHEFDPPMADAPHSKKSLELANVPQPDGSKLLDTCQPCSVSYLPKDKQAKVDFAESFEVSLASLHAAYLAAIAATSEVGSLDPIELNSQSLSLLDEEFKDPLSPLEDTLVNDDVDSLTWSQSLQEVLDEFRSAQIDDQDFRDLLCRDSSCYSKSCYSRSSFGSAYTSVAASPSMMHVLKRGLSGKRASSHTVSSRRWGSPKLAIMSLAEKARLRKQVCSTGSDDVLGEYLQTFAERVER